MFELDERCSRFFTWRPLIASGATYERLAREGTAVARPAAAETWQMLRGLAAEILDPLVERLGPVNITYGFAPPDLTRNIKKGIAPSLDQHAACELNRRGRPICDRGGAAVDIQLQQPATAALLSWLTSELPIDRLYFYGEQRPIHVSWHPKPSRSFWRMVESNRGHLMPRLLRLD